MVTSSADRSAGQVDLVGQRGHHGLQLAPLVQQRGGPPQGVLDALGPTTARGLVVGVERERPAVEAQQLEHDLVGRRPLDRPIGGRGHHVALVEPHAALPSIALDPQATRLRRGRQQPQDIR